MKGNNITIVIILAAAGIGYYLWTKRRKAAESLGATAGAAAGTAAVTAAANTAGQILTGTAATTTGTTKPGMFTFRETERNKVLKIGSSGPEVRALQIFLAKTGLTVDIDGSYGNQTQTGVNSYINNPNNLFIDLLFPSRITNRGGVTLQDFRIYNMDQNTSTVYGANEIPSLFSYEWTGNRLKGYDKNGKKWNDK